MFCAQLNIFHRFGYVVDKKVIEEGREMGIFRVFNDVNILPGMEYLIHEMQHDNFDSSSKIFPAKSRENLAIQKLTEIGDGFCETGVVSLFRIEF